MNFYAASVALLWTTAMRPMWPPDKMVRKGAEATVCDRDHGCQLPGRPEDLAVFGPREHVNV